MENEAGRWGCEIHREMEVELRNKYLEIGVLVPVVGA